MVNIFELYKPPIELISLTSSYTQHVDSRSNRTGVTIDLGRSVDIPLASFNRRAVAYRCGEYFCVTYCYVSVYATSIISLYQPGVYPIYSKYALRESWPYGTTPEVYIHMDGCSRFLNDIRGTKPQTEYGMLPQMLDRMVKQYGSEVTQYAHNHNIEFHELLLDSEFIPNLSLLSNSIAFIYNGSDAEVDIELAETLRNGGDSLLDLIEQISFSWGSSAVSPLWYVGRARNRLPEIGVHPVTIRGGEIVETGGTLVTNFNISSYNLFEAVMTVFASDFGFHINKGLVNNVKETMMYDIFTDTNMLSALNSSSLSHVANACYTGGWEELTEDVVSVMKTRNEILTLATFSEVTGFARVYNYDLMMMAVMSPALFDLNKTWPDNNQAWLQ